MLTWALVVHLSELMLLLSPCSELLLLLLLKFIQQLSI